MSSFGRRKLAFTKMHGLGNDFIVIDSLGPETQSLELGPEAAKKLCDRRFGVGADQILWLRKPHAEALDARMEILNADGSTAEMCGNGIRAVALFLRSRGPVKQAYQIETLAGVKSVELAGDGEVVVDMGAPELGAGFPSAGRPIKALEREFRYFGVSMGNPHAVIFENDVAAVALEKYGPLIETAPEFPKKTNVEFVEVLEPARIRVRVWERGAGVTLACGTGACAAAVAAIATGRTSNDVRVELPGGALRIRWEGARSPVMMQGPAQEVFRGTTEI